MHIIYFGFSQNKNWLFRVGEMLAKTNQTSTYASLGTPKSRSCNSFCAKIVWLKNGREVLKNNLKKKLENPQIIVTP